MLGYFGALGIQEFGISKNCIWLKGNLKMMIQFGIGSGSLANPKLKRSPRESRVDGAERRDATWTPFNDLALGGSKK